MFPWPFGHGVGITGYASNTFPTHHVLKEDYRKGMNMNLLEEGFCLGLPLGLSTLIGTLSP